MYESQISWLRYILGLKKSIRHIIESEWESEKIHVIITTYDYGFIHKKSIRFTYITIKEMIFIINI